MKKCYLICLKKLHDPVNLPHQTPITIGRSKDLNISDKECSRHQLKLTADCNRRFVSVKRCGSNPSQIDSIDIEKDRCDRLKPDQILHIIKMKYPHKCIFTDDISTIADEQKAVLTKKRPSTENNQPTIDNVCVPAKLKKSDNSKELELNKDKSISKSHWNKGLEATMSDPSSIVYQDEITVIIKDKYPKAKFHWLVLPVENISRPSHLSQKHEKLLKHMLKCGKEIAEKYGNESKFRFGYHAVPSMSTLHMHVISQDFNSTYLKTKKHWNSFTSEYFVDAEVMIEELELDGCIKNRKEFSTCLNNPLKCHICDEPQKNMPTLKKHILKCGGG